MDTLDNKIYVFNDTIGYINLIGHMGSEIDIVNDARVSFDKESKELTPKDLKLLVYLVEHKHYSTLRGVVFKFEVKAPLFACRQWWKHVISCTTVEEQRQWNEVSLRYTKLDPPEFYIPEHLYTQSKSNKQGSSLEPYKYSDLYINSLSALCREASMLYTRSIGEGISREQARMFLPANVYTRFRWTCSLQACLYFISLRNKPEAQYEIRVYADAMKTLLTPYAPNVIDYFFKNDV